MIPCIPRLRLSVRQREGVRRLELKDAASTRRANSGTSYGEWIRNEETQRSPGRESFSIRAAVQEFEGASGIRRRSTCSRSCLHAAAARLPTDACPCADRRDRQA